MEMVLIARMGNLPVEAAHLAALVSLDPLLAIGFHLRRPTSPRVCPSGSGSRLAREGRSLPGWMARYSLIDVTPEREFLTYGIGVLLLDMRDLLKARERAPVGI